ncbi:hypothetical protein F4804DRAFT_305908 [Jackrogersella minutella]|nr:hypothetical protein F4804DRAFT_305908 [Jackrogersella minutella]
MALFAAKAMAQATSCLDIAQINIPSCAQSCLLQDAPLAGCEGVNFTCQCQNEAILYAAIEPCVASGCPESSFQAVIDGASSVCNCATALHGALATQGSLGSFTVAPTATGSDTGTVASNLMATSTTSVPVTLSTSLGVAI